MQPSDMQPAGWPAPDARATAPVASVPVLAVPMFDPGHGRISMDAPHGLTIADIVDLALPDRGIAREYIRVVLVTPQGSQIVPPAIWHRVQPKAGVHVVIRVMPGKDIFRSLLQIVVSIAAVALGQFWAPALAGTLGISQAGWQGIIALGATAIGNLLINALIPPTKPDDQKQQNRYSISGWQNRIDQDGAIPFPVGETRYAPPFGVLSHSEIVGDLLYIRSGFIFGYGEVELDDFRIGDTSLAKYDEVEIDPRSGLEDDEFLSLFTRQRIEESVGAELVMPYPRDDQGEIIDDSDPEEEPVVRSTGVDASGASIVLAFPAGLWRSNDEGKLRNETVIIRIDQRLINAEEWQEVVTLKISARKREAFYRQHTWTFPSRGRWEISCTSLTPETENMQRSRRVSWAALQTIRPEYPFNFDQPLALVAVRIKSTHQLNGQLDNFNAVVKRVCLDYDHTTGTWVRRVTRNPAAIYRLVLQHAANPRPVLDSGIDLANLEEWHDFCRTNNLKFDKVFDDANASIGDVLSEIAAAGRATKRHDGIRWGVVIDRPQAMLLVDDFSPRNSYGFKVTRSYINPPDGFRIKFPDATNDHKPAERLVPWPGKEESEIKLTEVLSLPGKTDPDEIYLEARRRMYEALYRPDAYQVSQDTPVGVATRGDKVVLSHDVIERTQKAARVRSAIGRLIEIDEDVTMSAGENYAVRFRVFEGDEDTVGASVIRQVVTQAGETKLLLLKGDGDLPTADAIVFFGIAGKESLELIVRGVEAGQDSSRHLTLIDAAPIIDELMADEVAPPWSGRVGSEIGGSILQPPAPRFTSVQTGLEGTDQTGLITYLIAPGTGPIQTASIEVSHRLTGAPTWTTVTIPAANGGGEISGYANGNAVQMKARAISADAVPGPETTVIAITVGAKDAAIPVALDSTKISVGALLGGAVAQFITGDDTATKKVQIYRSQSAVLNRATDAVGNPIAIERSRSYSAPLGDVTRENLLLNGTMDSSTVWGLPAGCVIASGKATKTAGTAGAISQALAAQAGKYYRISGTLSGVTAGTVTPRLTGGTTRSGVARNANGGFTDRIQAVSGNVTFELYCDAAFAGSLDDVVAYLETATCLAQGVHYIWLEPQNDDGVPGPVAGPFAVTIK